MNTHKIDASLANEHAVSRRSVLGSGAMALAGVCVLTGAAEAASATKTKPCADTTQSVAERNLAATKAYYAASGNWDVIAGMLTDDFHATESPSLPMAGTYRGIEGLKKLYTTLLIEMIDATRYDIYQMMSGGEWVVSLMNVYARDTDGSEIELSIAESLRWRDGKLCEMKPYWFDGNALVRAVEAKKHAKAG